MLEIVESGLTGMSVICLCKFICVSPLDYLYLKYPHKYFKGETQY
jgi:hypothetical protein